MPFYFVYPVGEITNVVTNPSLELATTTGWTAVGGSISASINQSYKGAYSCSVVVTSATTNGCYYTFTTGSATTTYRGTVYVYGALGVPYTAYIATTGAVLVGTATTFTGTGTWQRVDVLGASMTGSTSYRFYVTKNGSSSTTTFYVDALMIQNTVTMATYVDGDEDDCYWLGTRHASQSVNYKYTGKVGALANLSADTGVVSSNSYNLGHGGTGTPPIQTNSTPYSAIDGSFFQGQITRERPFTLMYHITPDTDYTDSVEGWHASRKQIFTFLKNSRVPGQQPIRIIYTDGVDDVYIDAVYDGGMEIQDGSKDVEAVSLRFIAHDPYWYKVKVSGGQISVYSSTSNANYIMRKDSYSAWSAMGTGGSGGAVYAFCEGVDCTIYAGGAFTSMNAVANTSRIAKWNPSTSAWSAMTTGVTGGSVYALATAPNGDIIVGGSFTSAGGVGSTNGLALWNGSAWSSIGTLAGGGSDCYAIAYDADGNLIIGGDFTSVGGVAATNIAKRSPSGTWTAFGSGVGSSVNAIAVSPGNVVYVGGSFLTANGGVTTVNGVTYWTGSAWAQMGPTATPGAYGAANSAVYHLIFAPDGRLILSGPFRTAGGVSCNHVASWNGVSFTPFGSGVGYNATAALADSTGIVDSLFFPNGTWLAGGQFGDPTSSFVNPIAGGLAFPDSLAIWTGSAWVYADIDLPGTAKISAGLLSSLGNLYVGYDTSGTATFSTPVSFLMSGSADAWPVIRIAGPSSGTARLYQVKEELSGYTIFFDTIINAGETITIDLNPGVKTVTSSFYGNIISQVLPGSALSTFKLTQNFGSTYLSIYSSSSTVVAVATWKDRCWSIDG